MSKFDDESQGFNAVENKRRLDPARWLYHALLEPPFRKALFDIATREGLAIDQVFARVEEQRARREPFEAAARAFALTYYQAAATEDGHTRAGHGARNGVNM